MMLRTVPIKKTKYGFTILAIDPSFLGFGWSVIENNKILDFGCIRTQPADKKLRIRKGDDRIRRLSEISNVIKEVIKKYEIQYIVSELPHGSQSAIAANLLGMITGFVFGIAESFNIPVEWFSEADSKRAILFKDTATKSEMIKAVSQIFKINWTGTQYKDEAIADSLAVYHIALKNSFVIKTFCKID